MIHIFSTSSSTRLQYIAEIIFGTLLNIPYEIIAIDEGFDLEKIIADRIPALLYGIPSTHLPSMPAEGLLYELEIKQREIFVEEKEVPEIHFPSLSGHGYVIGFDLFSAAFYLLTLYKDYAAPLYDVHDRYDDSVDPLFREDYYRIPLVDIYADYLRAKLAEFFPGFEKQENSFDYRITFDVDSPYLYTHKGLGLTLASVLKNGLNFNINNLKEQIKAVSSGRDPYDVYDYILAKVPPYKLLFFFLLDRHHAHDTRYTYKNQAYRALIKSIAMAGIETGIHPSYTSYKNAGMIAFETLKLKEITGMQVKSARMHFLRFALPETFQSLIKAGITNDYTLCPVNTAGFRNFIARPFPWFDLSLNVSTNLVLHPTMVMDRSLQKYMQLNPGEAWLEIKNIINTTRQYNGVFTILFHNSTVSETAEWKGWKEIFERTADYLLG